MTSNLSTNSEITASNNSLHTIMSNSTCSDQLNSINLLIKKLGHELEEIRTRSLDTLISKLNSQVITQSDLVQHKQLFVKLFELFNFADFKQHEQVLDLLIKFIKHEAAIRNIKDINGIEFLNAMKQDLKERNLILKVDEIIKNVLENNANEFTMRSSRSNSTYDSNNTLFMTQSTNLSSTNKPAINYTSSNSVNSSSLKVICVNNDNQSSKTSPSSLHSSSTSSIASSSLSNRSNNQNSSQEQLMMTSGEFKKLDLNFLKDSSTTNNESSSDATLINMEHHQGSANTTASGSKSIQTFTKSYSLSNVKSNNDSNLLLMSCRDSDNTNNTQNQSQSFNFNFNSNSLFKLSQQQQTSKHNELSFKNNNKINESNEEDMIFDSINKLNFQNSNQEEFIASSITDTFNWLPLTFMDRQFLQTAENSLRSNDSKKIKSYCTFLQTIVFNDFPAEIFLQRSSILKILIDLITKSTNNALQSDAVNGNSNLNGEYDYSLIKCLITCFHLYCIKLKKRIDYAKDPSTFSDKDSYSHDFENLSRKFQTISSGQSTARSTNSDKLLPKQAPPKTANIKAINTKKPKKSNLRSNQVNNVLNTSLYSSSPNNNDSTLSSIKSSIAGSNGESVLKSHKKTSKHGKDEAGGLLSLLHDEQNDDELPQIDETQNQDLQLSMETLLSETNSENYETDINEKEHIRRTQEWPIHLFCFKLLDTLLEMLSLLVVKNNNKNNLQLQTSLLPLILDTINNLLEILYETSADWASRHQSKNILNETLISLFAKLNANLKYIMNKHSNQSCLNMFNRISCVYLTLTFYKLVYLVQQKHKLLNAMPHDTASVLFYLLNDICFVDSFGGMDLKNLFGTLLFNLDKQLYEVYLLSEDICESMESACQFLLKNEDKMMSKEELAKMAKRSLNYMDYFKCKEFPSQIVNFCSRVCSKDDISNELRSQIEYLLTSCMISESDEIRVQTYSGICDLVNDCINVQIATEVNSKRHTQLNFLLLKKVFYQLISFGLFDKCLQVEKLCKNILSHLLQCELLVPDSFRLKLTQLIVIYMPFIQCFASQMDPLGQCIFKMSDDMLTPSLSQSNRNLNEDGLKLFLTPAIERLRCSMRYLFSKDKSLRKKGFLQTIGFLTKYNTPLNLNEDHQQVVKLKLNDAKFELNDFYLKFLPDKYCDLSMLFRNGNGNKSFFTNELTSSSSLSTINQYSTSIFQTDNLLRVYSIFTSEKHIDLDVKQNAGEQLAIMISTGDLKLHKAFINLDGVNYCMRLLRNDIFTHPTNSNHLFLNGIEKTVITKVQASCLACIANVLYFNKEIRQIYLFDVDFYRLIFKYLITSFYLQSKQENTSHIYSLASSIQVDASTILFILLYNQVSSLDYYYESSSQVNQAFDLSLNLKENLSIPFNLNSNKINGQNELKLMEKQRSEAYKYNLKLNAILTSKQHEENLNKSMRVEIKEILDRKFRLFWNFKWHGGSILRLCNELICNEEMLTLKKENCKGEFNQALCLDELDKNLVKNTQPFFLFKQLSSQINFCSTHQEALSALDLMQSLISCVDQKKFKLDINQYEQDDTDSEFTSKHSLTYYFNRYISDWHLALNRFTSILPSTKSRQDQLLYSSSFQTISRMLTLQFKRYNTITKCSTDNQVALISNEKDIDTSMLSLDKWLYQMIYNPSSSLLLMIKQFLITYESDETRINSYILPLCDFLKVYFDRLCSASETNYSIDYLMPPMELLKICIEQIQACEIEKFRNLNKLAILINLIGSLLRVCLFNNRINEEQEDCDVSGNAFFNKNNKIFIQLIKSLVQIINTFNIGRGGLSLSFMGNFITKSAHISLLQLIKNTIIITPSNNEAVQQRNAIRSISFSIISILINVQFAKTKLANLLRICLNVLLNKNECSIVRIQSCAFLINLTQSMINKDLNETKSDENSISIINLQLMLEEFNFYEQIAFTLSTFYPFETYSFNEIKSKSLTKLKDQENVVEEEDLSICSPLLVSSICQLLYNLNLLMGDVNLASVNNKNILSLLISYVKPVNLLTKKSIQQVSSDEPFRLNENLIEMLHYIVAYLNLCCQMDQACVLMLLKSTGNGGRNLVYDLVECLSINAINKDKLRPFYSKLFELLSTLLFNIDEQQTKPNIIENCLITISKCWTPISNFILNEILANNSNKNSEYKPIEANQNSTLDIYKSHLFENSLKFYSIYLSKLSSCHESNSYQSQNIQILYDNIAYLFDYKDDENETDPNASSLIMLENLTNNKLLNNENNYCLNTLGGKMCQQLIKQFDKYFLVSTNQNYKIIVSNVIKGLFAISDTAKQVAVNSGLIETLIEHLKYTHSKLNLKSLSTKGMLKDSTFISDLSQTLLILKYLMCNNLEIKETITKSNLISIIHSFWCWAIQDQSLIKACLSTLCTLTANNKLAINQMAQSNISAQTSSSINPGTASSNGLSLLYSIIKTLQKSLTNNTQQQKSFQIQKFAFSLLTNCAQSNECKNIIWKSNFLQEFTSIDNYPTSKSIMSKTNFKREKLWLQFLLSLSFSQDGQQFFMKVDSLLSLVIKFLETFVSQQQSLIQLSSQQLEIQYLCLLILRNLCFNQANKSKLVSNADYVNTIIHALRNKDEKFQLVALSAIDSLIFEYQKSKVIFKNANVLKFLVELGEYHHNLKVNTSKSNNRPQSSLRILSMINNLIKVLNE